MPKKPKGPVGEFLAPAQHILKMILVWSLVLVLAGLSLFFGFLLVIAKIFS